MGNILDYVKEYGYLDFDEKPFNDVDGLILSQFAYLKMDGIVPEVGTMKAPIEIRDLAYSKNFEALFGDERYEKSNREFYNAIALTRRFGLIRVNHYINLINKRWEMQFSAVCCDLLNGINVVAYRGTDETLIGWKEDFNMAFLTPVPAQIKAVDYLNYVAERIDGDIITAGHSKGGNLAVYAAMKCPEMTRNRILKIYSYDGPGFLKETLEGSDFNAIKSKICKLVPGSSIVGMLLQTQEDYGVVACRSFGIMQHDPFNWEVEKDDFIRKNDVNEAFLLQNKAITDWAVGTDPATMRAFADKILDVFIKCGINNLNDMKGKKAEFLKNLAQVMEDMDEEDKEVIRTVGKALFNSVIETLKSQSDK